MSVTALVFLVPCKGQLTEGQLPLQERLSEQGFYLTMHDLVMHFITSRIITQQSNAYWKNTFLQ